MQMEFKQDFSTGDPITSGATTPKLSFFSLPNQPPDEPPGMLTPPLRPPASVPFHWEEAPGKPRTTSSPTTTTSSRSTSVSRCLELPPRLLSEAKITNMPSPTTVLDGPYVGRSASYSSALCRDQRIRSSSKSFGGSPDGKRGEYCSKDQRGSFFGSWRRRGTFNFKGNSTTSARQVVEDSSVIFPCSAVGGSDEEAASGGGGSAKVKITRFRRSSSVFSVSNNARTHLWASVFGSLKQMVPWRSTKGKKDGCAV